jgi:hypothetical protein
MKLLILEILVSAVYVFDVSAYPFVHVPFLLLTLLYFGSMLELYGLVQLVKFVRRRIASFGRDGRTRLLNMRLARTFSYLTEPFSRRIL